jgi:hypothetical protein
MLLFGEKTGYLLFEPGVRPFYSNLKLKHAVHGIQSVLKYRHAKRLFTTQKIPGLMFNALFLYPGRRNIFFQSEFIRPDCIHFIALPLDQHAISMVDAVPEVVGPV